jgi:transcriptional regulator with XRE-family HTH domain
VLRQTVTQIFSSSPFFVAMDGQEKSFIRLKCALILNRLLDKNKSQYASNLNNGLNDLKLVHNLSQVSSSTGLRPATVSNIFNGDSAPSVTSLLHILDVLGSSMTQFGVAYDKTSDLEVVEFKKELISKKERELVKKGKH